MTKANATIKYAALLWLKRCKLDGLERATIRSYKGHFMHHIGPKIGGLLLEEFTAADVQDFIDEMLEENSRAMTKKVLTSLRSILSTAQSRGMIDKNVAREIKLRRASRNDKERIIPTKDEIRLLIDKAPPREKPLVITAILTGMRSSELRGLSWAHVDFTKGLIHIKQRADRYNAIGVPKSRAGIRTIPMSPLVASTLKDWKARCPKGELNLVFPNGAGNVEGHANIYHRIFKPLMIACENVDSDGKLKFGFHSLRHAAASLFIEQGWTPKKIQVLLGHSSINMTFDVYGHLFHNPEEDIAQMAKMESDLLAT
ncbi:tyrosine-type recombinase/integrase [Sneathiella litorea]|uniref:Tyrosine-type recombinase/integrase n=1 Tax=Sneathiella litorea TaxID=2606216 RepID=A0A6L8W8N0_9PROT|nr:site-specific integrase [Sneathiella litorea]MZR31488.1 tyrosine-type recombinase/integrase [Sneathiella litorea]